MRVIYIRDFDKTNELYNSHNPIELPCYDVFQRVIAYQLMDIYVDNKKSNDDVIDVFWTLQGMMMDCNLKTYSFMCDILNGVNYKDTSTFKHHVKSIAKEYLETALKLLEKKGIIKIKNVLIATGKAVTEENGDVRYKTVKLSKDDEDMYHTFENKLLSEYKNKDGSACKNQDDIYSSGNAKYFYEQLSDVCYRYFGCRYIFPAYGIEICPKIVEYTNLLLTHFTLKGDFMLANSDFCDILKCKRIDLKKYDYLIEEMVQLSKNAIDHIKMAGSPKYNSNYGLNVYKEEG